MTERDYSTEIYSLARVFLTGNTGPNGITAEEMVQSLREQDPDLLTGWMETNAVAIMTDFLNRVDRADRVRARYGAKGRSFADAVLRFEAGDKQALDVFRTVHVIGGRRVEVGKMTRSDHQMIAARYTRSAARQKFLAQVHNAIAQRLQPGQSTEDVFTPEAYLLMFEGVG